MLLRGSLLPSKVFVQQVALSPKMPWSGAEITCFVTAFSTLATTFVPSTASSKIAAPLLASTRSALIGLYIRPSPLNRSIVHNILHYFAIVALLFDNVKVYDVVLQLLIHQITFEIRFSQSAYEYLNQHCVR
mmetsp:Transcript_45806/g.91369  ORF Transcript_45806/g.91369 Transcript_45806/m.91369 type:complete len:132 (-) Transcript_45806:638-1033(-)